ncbi:MAG: hypothetical protein QXQ94_08580 [Candidatus Bathyarchaeia archaeon]
MLPEKESKRLIVHFQIDSERAVRDAFARYHAELGYPKILVSQESFPDYILEDASGSKIRAEAEFRSSGYNHPIDGCDLVICWEVDRKLPIPTLELCRYIELPHVFDGFKEGELADISEHVKRYAVVADKSKNLMKELASLIKRRDHRSICSDLYASGESYDAPVVATIYSQQYGREGWEVNPVVMVINFLNEELIIEGRLYSYLPNFKVISLDRWKELFHDAQEESFKCFLKPYGPEEPYEVSIDTFVQNIPDPNKIWCVAFVRKYDFNFLYEKCDLVISSLSTTIISMLDFLEKIKLYGQQGASV